jgi:hypothetical protein
MKKEKPSASLSANGPSAAQKLAATLPDSVAKDLLARFLEPDALFSVDAEGRNAMGRAIVAGDAAMVSFLARAEPLFFTRPCNIQRNQPFQLAILEGSLDVRGALADALVEHADRGSIAAADAQWLANWGLKQAIVAGDASFVEKLFPLRSPELSWASATESHGYFLSDQPLAVAAAAKRWELFHWLLARSRGDEINACDHDGSCLAHRLLQMATDEDSRDEVRDAAFGAFRALSERPDWDADNLAAPKRRGLVARSPLFAAVAAGHVEAVRLLAEKTDVSAPRQEMGEKSGTAPANRTSRRTRRSLLRSTAPNSRSRASCCPSRLARSTKPRSNGKGIRTSSRRWRFPLS